MGTRFELAIVMDEAQQSEAQLRAIGELALREIDDWYQRLTRFEADSWLSHVNRTAADEAVPQAEATASENRTRVGAR